MKKIFINNIVFRIVTPPIYGTIVYILILLVFDTLDQLTVSFFGREVLLTIILTYFLSESMRLGIIWLDKLYPVRRNFGVRISLQLISGAAICSFVVISSLVSIYFFFFEGYTTFSSFSTELITLNIIFILTSIFYNMLYFSIFFLNQQNEVQLERETTLRENLEFELQSFKNEINPELLYGSLETLISLVHKNPQMSEEFIGHLSEVYRYKLDNKHNELAYLGDELKSVQNLLYLLNLRYSGNIKFNVNIPEEVLSYKIVPGTLQVIMENSVLYNIVSDIQPLEIDCVLKKDNYLVIKNKLNKRLYREPIKYNRIENIKKAYTYYTDRPLEEKIVNGNFFVTIPLLELDEAAKVHST